MPENTEWDVSIKSKHRSGKDVLHVRSRFAYDAMVKAVAEYCAKNNHSYREIEWLSCFPSGEEHS